MRPRRPTGGERGHHHRSENDAKQGDQRHRHRGEREHLPGEIESGLIPFLFDLLGERRDKRRRKRPLGKEITKHVRNAESDHVAVHPFAPAEQPAEHDLTDQAEHPAAHDGDRHQPSLAGSPFPRRILVVWNAARRIRSSGDRRQFRPGSHPAEVGGAQGGCGTGIAQGIPNLIPRDECSLGVLTDRARIDERHLGAVPDFGRVHERLRDKSQTPDFMGNGLCD